MSTFIGNLILKYDSVADFDLPSPPLPYYHTSTVWPHWFGTVEDVIIRTIGGDDDDFIYAYVLYSKILPTI